MAAIARGLRGVSVITGPSEPRRVSEVNGVSGCIDNGSHCMEWAAPRRICHRSEAGALVAELCAR
jgi:hypothetical protein